MLYNQIIIIELLALEIYSNDRKMRLSETKLSLLKALQA